LKFLIVCRRGEKEFFNFIWQDKEDRIKRTTLYQDLEKGLSAYDACRTYVEIIETCMDTPTLDRE